MSEKINYPICVNGRCITNIPFAGSENVKETVMNNELVRLEIDGREFVKLILVEGRMISIIVK